MTTRSLRDMLVEHPFFVGCSSDCMYVVTGCAANARFSAGAMLCQEGEPAEHFYLLREGRVAIECFVPGRGKVSIQTLGPGDVFGWSWIVPPYVFDFDARVLHDSRVVSLDAACLRGKCDVDAALGYELLRRFSGVMVDRLRHTRMRLLDLYGAPS